MRCLVIFLTLGSASALRATTVSQNYAQAAATTSRPSISSLTLQLPSQETDTASDEILVVDGEVMSGKVVPSAIVSSSKTPVPADKDQVKAAADAAADRLMEVATGGSGAYALMSFAVLIVALHAVLAFGTLSGVLLNSAIVADLGLPIETVALGNSLVFFGWIPGALFGGPVGDRFGRKPALIGFSVLAALGICATGLTPEDAATPYFASRLLTGVGLGGFISPAFALLVESSDPRRTGQASVTWTWGYVGGVVLLCALHYGCSMLECGWRIEELSLGAFVLAFAAATQLLVTESPRYLLASGETTAAIDSARTMARWNGVELDAALESDAELAPLRDAADACALLNEECDVSAISGTEGGADAAAMGAGSARTGSARTDECAEAASACAVPADDAVRWADLFSLGNGEGETGYLPLTLTFGCMEVAYNMAFYVIVFSAGAISDNLLLNLVLLAAADLPGSTAAGFFSDSIGAKRTACLFLSAASTALLSLAAYTFWVQAGAEPAALSAFLPQEVVTIGLSLLGKSMCSGAFTAVHCAAQASNSRDEHPTLPPPADASTCCTAWSSSSLSLFPLPLHSLMSTR